MEKFTTKSTSAYSEIVQEPIIIEENQTTRKIFFATLNDQNIATGETVSGNIVHQRKNTNDQWEDVKSVNLATLKGGEGVKLRLDSRQTKKLFEGLKKLYAISREGVKSGEIEYIVGSPDEMVKVPKERKKYISQLLEENFAEEIWNALVSKDPDLASRLSMGQIQAERAKSLTEFEKSLREEKDEAYWQNFFSKNEWIFGYGLKYQFLNQVTDQPSYGGGNFTGKGNQKGDYLLSTQANIKFTVLVEIKTPATPLIAMTKNGPKRYRNGAYLLSSDLSGGVSQLQINCKTWLRSAFEPQNSDRLVDDNIYTISPKGILIVGNTKEFGKDREKIETFEAYRNSISNPTIVTFDELYERAKFIIENQMVEQENTMNEIDNLINDLPF